MMLPKWFFLLAGLLVLLFVRKRSNAILMLSALILASGCGKHDHAFFKPEISGATYAVPAGDGPTADDSRAIAQEVKAVLDINIRCDGSGNPCIDVDGTFEGWGFVDDGAYYAAPGLVSPNADSDGGVQR